MAQHSSQDDHKQSFIQGPLHEAADVFAARFTASIGFDYRLAAHDIAVSIAHARMLGNIGVLNDAEQNSILTGLAKIQAAVATGSFNWRVDLEDVHMNIEHRLIDIIGEAGKKLHTGRSRNDQVATSIRLYLRSEIDAIIEQLMRLIHVFLSLAATNAATIMPGFTHLQVAQPITFGHHMLAWAAMLERDVERLLDCHSRVNRLPLGSAALAGTSFPIDRKFLASQLGFSALCPNSLDAVSDRDFAIEFCAFASLLLMHFSRMAEELILWSSAQFNFISLPDRFCTGSSIMPQKKNPDVPELVRGKSGRVFGHLMSLLTLMKAQPLAYNKDNQEDKEPVFDVVDTVQDCVRALTDMLPHIELHPDRMMEAVAGFATATDLADYLVTHGVPFREAHTTVGRIVAVCIDQGRTLTDLSLDELQAFSPVIAQDVMTALALEGSVASRSHEGGTAPKAVVAAIADTQTRLARLQQRHQTACACYPAPEPPPKNQR